MIDRFQSNLILEKATQMIWQVRNHILIEEPQAADRLVCAVMEVKDARKEILRLLPTTTEITKEAGTGEVVTS